MVGAWVWLAGAVQVYYGDLQGGKTGTVVRNGDGRRRRRGGVECGGDVAEAVERGLAKTGITTVVGLEGDAIARERAKKKVDA